MNMRLSDERIKELKRLIKQEFGLDYTDEQAQEAGLAIMRFVLAKEQRKKELRSRGPGNKKDGRVNS
jgi:hypothetical protein